MQALVDAGSPRASDVLASLISYLRAAVPRLNDPATTLGEETRLVQAYLELMHMRMPDRLQFTMQIDETARAISHVTRGDETAGIHLKGRKEVLAVSHSYLQLFRQM